TPAQRIGLSATVRPVDEVSTFLAGGRPVRTVQPATPKQIEVRVEVPVPDLSDLSAPAPSSPVESATPEAPLPENGDSPDRETTATPQASIWPSVQQRMFELIQQHRSTIVFTNSRKLAERLTAGLNELA